MAPRIFDPSEGSGSSITASLVATSTDSFTAIRESYLADQREREQARLERSMRSLGFGQRASYCG